MALAFNTSRSKSVRLNPRIVLLLLSTPNVASVTSDIGPELPSRDEPDISAHGARWDISAAETDFRFELKRTSGLERGDIPRQVLEIFVPPDLFLQAGRYWPVSDLSGLV